MVMIAGKAVNCKGKDAARLGTGGKPDPRVSNGADVYQPTPPFGDLSPVHASHNSDTNG